MTAIMHQLLQVHETVHTAKARSDSRSQHTFNMTFTRIRTGAPRIKLWVPTQKVRKGDVVPR